MSVIARIRRLPGVLIGMLAIAAVMVVSQPARSYTGSTGYAVKITAAPTVGLTDGQAVAVHVDASGLTMFDLQAHLCRAGAGIKNGFEFDLDGPYCSPSKVSNAADAAVEQKVTGSTADLTFHVGAGTGAPWDETDGGTHTLTCGVGAPCDLVIQVALTGQNVYHAIPLCYGRGCGPEPTAPAVVPAAVGAGGTGAGTTGSQAAGTADPSGDAGRGVPTGTGAPAGGGAGTGTASSGRAAQSSGPSGSGDAALSVSAASGPGAGSPAAPWRIALAGIAGLLCGARIVSVLGRARRPTMGLA